MDRDDFPNEADWQNLVVLTDKLPSTNRGPMAVDKRSTPEREPVAHYATPGGIETIDYIKSLGILQEFAAGNVIKYVSRAGRKDGNTALGDLKKARTYINFMIEELESEDEDR